MLFLLLQRIQVKPMAAKSMTLNQEQDIIHNIQFDGAAVCMYVTLCFYSSMHKVERNFSLQKL